MLGLQYVEIIAQRKLVRGHLKTSEKLHWAKETIIDCKLKIKIVHCWLTNIIDIICLTIIPQKGRKKIPLKQYFYVPLE